MNTKHLHFIKLHKCDEMWKSISLVKYCHFTREIIKTASLSLLGWHPHCGTKHIWTSFLFLTPPKAAIGLITRNSKKKKKKIGSNKILGICLFPEKDPVFFSMVRSRRWTHKLLSVLIWPPSAFSTLFACAFVCLPAAPWVFRCLVNNF